MTEAQSDSSGTCTFCGWGYVGRPNQCKRCGTLLNDPAEDVKRQGKAGRGAIKVHKALADTFFLIGLLLGGPMMTIGDNLRVGLFIVLAGGLASTLRRYTDLSTTVTVALGGLGATIAATTLVASAADSPEEPAVAEAARAAYASALAEQDPDVFVDTRGLEHVAIWFTVPQDLLGECGEYPAPEVRAHLNDLGFRRVVVTMRNQSGGLCSFSP
jgi:hypothetical protein